MSNEVEFIWPKAKWINNWVCLKIKEFNPSLIRNKSLSNTFNFVTSRKIKNLINRIIHLLV